MNITGKTPLFRARHLEALLGVKKIFLKLEGANPHGHKFDRLAEYLVRDALFRKKSGILAEGPLTFIQAVIYFANTKNVPVVVPICKGEGKKQFLKGDYELLKVQFAGIKDYRQFVANHCQKHRLFNGYYGVASINTSIIALEDIGDELYDKFGDSIDNIFLQLAYGIGLTGVHNSFERRFIRGISQSTPSLVCCTIPEGNIIYDYYKKNFNIPESQEDTSNSTKQDKLLQIRNTDLLESALNAVYDTSGTILGIEKSLLVECVKQLRIKEQVFVSKEEAYSLAGLFQMARSGKLKDGNHVVILNDGKSDLQIESVEKGTYTIEQMHQYVDLFLKEYSDSYGEITNALTNASKKGAIFLARRNNTVQGIAVVVHMGFEKFIPTYHLGYIGTKEGNEGRGIATKLLEGVIQFSGGKVSLHVDLDNLRAMRVYEKMGFQHCYNRMIYKG